MHAIIRLGNGKFYTSAIFGRYKGEGNNYGTDIFIVYNQAKDKLIALPQISYGEDNIIHTNLIIFDTHDISWKFSYGARRYGFVSFLNREKAMQIIQTGRFPSGTNIESRCRQEDESLQYKKWHKIRTTADIKNLMEATGGFHDAYVKECKKEKQSGDIFIRFSGIWGTDLEMVFQGEAKCHLHDPEESEPWWFDAKLQKFQGKYYLFDSADASIAEFDNWSTDCFCAKEVYYHIVPR